MEFEIVRLIEVLAEFLGNGVRTDFAHELQTQNPTFFGAIRENDRGN